MQEDSGRRVLFTTGNNQINPLSVANQAARTANAEIGQIERQKNQDIQDIDSIVRNTFKIYETGKSVRTQLNEQELLSAKTDLQKNQIEYENLVSQGGLIDSEKISYQEKLSKKRQAYDNLQLKIAQNKQLLEGQKGLFQSILGTEEAYNQAIASFDNQSQEILNVAQRQLSSEARQAEVAVSKENLNATINAINSANNNSQIDKTTNASITTLNDLERNGYITPAEKQKSLNDLSRQVNNRKVDVFLNNIDDALARGVDPSILVKEVTNAYNLTREGKAFNQFYGSDRELAQTNRVENETKLRNALFGIQKEVTKNYTLSLPYNISVDDALKDVPESQQKNVVKLLEMRNNVKNADFEAMQIQNDIKKGNTPLGTNFSDPKVISNYQMQNGVAYKSSLTSEKAKAFIVSAKDIGFPKNKIINGNSVPISNVEQMQEWYNSQVEFLGSQDAVEKEANFHLDKEIKLIVKGVNNGESFESYADIIDKVIVAKNLGNFAIQDDNKLDSEALKDYYKTSEGKYLEKTGRVAEAQSNAKAYRKISEAIGSSKISNTVDRFTGKIDYISTDNKNIEFDRNLYNRSDLEKSINIVLANSREYLNLDNKFEISETDIIKAESSISGAVTFYAYPQNGNPKFSIGSYRFEDLPQPLSVEEEKKLENLNIQKQVAKKELENRENWANFKENITSPAYYKEKGEDFINFLDESYQENINFYQKAEETRAENRKALKKSVSKIAKEVVNQVENLQKFSQEKNIVSETIKLSDEELRNIVKSK